MELGYFAMPSHPPECALKEGHEWDLQVMRWLDELGYREEGGMASDHALEQGLATTFEMATGQGKNQTRKITHWNLHLVQRILVEAGHPLDFDYEKSLKGTGRNGDVKVETVDDRARAFAKEFAKLFKDKERRRVEVPKLLRKTPKVIQRKGEEILGKPGLLTKEIYKKYLDRA